MRSLRCAVGRHEWKKHIVTDKGGPKSVYQRCNRCGRERTRFVAMDPAVRVDRPDRAQSNPWM
jgi:hypothetical protein